MLVELPILSGVAQSTEPPKYFLDLEQKLRTSGGLLLTKLTKGLRGIRFVVIVLIIVMFVQRCLI